MNIWNWLASLTEEEKSAASRPVGMSRRGFLRAIGITAVTVTAGGVLLPEIKIHKPVLTPQNIADFVNATLQELGRPSFVDIAADLQRDITLSQLLFTDTAKIKIASSIQFNYQLGR